MSTSPNPVPAAAPGTPAPAARTESSFRSYSVAGVGRVVGYGLIATFACDLPQIVYGYIQRPLDAAADATLVTQTIGRVSIPMIGFGLIFGWPAHDAPRWDRVLRKLLSYFMLLSALASLMLAGVAVSAGVRQYRRASAEVDFRANQRSSALSRLNSQLATLNGEALRTTYNAVVHPAPGAPLPPIAQMRQQIGAGIPSAIDGINSSSQAAHAEGRRQEIISTTRFIGDGLVAAVVFFVLWEASHSARSYRIFRQRGAPTLSVEGAVIGGLANVGRKIESIRILPDPEGWSWYRRLRRKWRHRKEKRDR